MLSLELVWQLQRLVQRQLQQLVLRQVQQQLLLEEHIPLLQLLLLQVQHTLAPQWLKLLQQPKVLPQLLALRQLVYILHHSLPFSHQLVLLLLELLQPSLEVILLRHYRRQRDYRGMVFPFF